MDCSPLGSSTHGIFQTRVLEWVAIAFSDMEYYSAIKGRKFAPLQVLHSLRNLVPQQGLPSAWNAGVF